MNISTDVQILRNPDVPIEAHARIKVEEEYIVLKYGFNGCTVYMSQEQAERTIAVLRDAVETLEVRKKSAAARAVATAGVTG